MFRRRSNKPAQRNRGVTLAARLGGNQAPPHGLMLQARKAGLRARFGSPPSQVSRVSTQTKLIPLPALALALALAACGGKDDPKHQQRTPEAGYVVVTAQDVPLVVELA